MCYVTDRIIATSGPSSTYPQRAYRNSLDALVSYLDGKHGSDWAIWEFRAEGTGYPDEAVHGRIKHFPWPDHHPPPFGLIPRILDGMREWLDGGLDRVVVVHCKAGKGRSGTIACSYLISEEGWDAVAALNRFTERRMRALSGAGVSIPSQLRWVEYVSRWAAQGKVYLEGSVEVMELRIWGLRDGVTVNVEGYVDEGKTIKTFHVFDEDERHSYGDDTGRKGSLIINDDATSKENGTTMPAVTVTTFRPKPGLRIILPTKDINISLERRRHVPLNAVMRNKNKMLTSVARVWFNAFFERGRLDQVRSSSSSSKGKAENEENEKEEILEGREGNAEDNEEKKSETIEGEEKEPQTCETASFEILWEDMDGIKGASFKGSKALDKLSVFWREV